GIDSFEALILSNPFIQSPGDEVNARTLLNWVLQHNELKNEKNQEDSIFLDVLKKLYSIGAFLHREENNRIILIATAKYLDLKKGINTKQIEIIKIPYFKSCQTTIIDSPNPDYLTSYKEDYQEKHNIGYYDILIENLRQYSGPYKEIQIHCPIFFKLLCDILNDRFTDWHTKIMISSCLAYFVLEKDVIPDHQETGYIDDLFIVSYVLKEI